MERVKVPRRWLRLQASTRLAAAVGLIALLLALVPAEVVAGDKQAGLRALVGVWRLDRNVSEDPRRLLRQARRRSAGRGRSDRGGGENSLDPSLEERVDALTAGAEVLTFAYRDELLTLIYWDDRQRVFRVDGKKVAETRPAGRVEVQASWKSSDRLIVKTTGGPAGKEVEIFEIGERGDKLFVTVELYRKGSKDPFSFESLYFRVASRN
ncbi:MAG: hypothetical protein O7A98_08175 [Acidobacteria bacterium]|nr:hypothetical protein [Acidobacteriota bacterium]